jgi:hypothetical protein
VSATLSYVFCLVRAARRPAVRHIIEGMPAGRDLRAVEASDGLWAIVETVPESEYGEAALARGLQDLDWVAARAVAHERVIDSFLSASALLPMQLFTLFTSDQRVVEYVGVERARIARILKRVENKVEFGVRMTWNASALQPRAPKTRVRTGTEFLARKRDILDVNRTGLAAARKRANVAYRDIGRHAAGSHRRTSLERAAPGSRLLLDAAFLVTTRKSGAFKAAVRSQTRGLRGTGINLVLSGPWPAYNFIQ